MAQSVRAFLVFAAAALPMVEALADAPNEIPDYCVAAAPGGAAPPEVLSTEQLATVKAILAKYRPDTLSGDDARVIRQALHDAGLRPGLALDKALAAAGFSAKRLATLAPCPSTPQNEAEQTATDRSVPPPQ